MKIAFNPSTVAALITPPNNKDITFDLRGRNIFARGVKFCGTDTWRDIKINNVSIGSNILDLRNGSNTTLTNTNGVVTINSTWRPVVDNLTSDSTTSSLSANQGRVLKSLIDGKSNSDHNHDGRYLRLNGSDTMQGNLNLCSIGTSYIGRGSGDKSGADFTEANIVIRSWWGISFKSYDDIVRTYIDTRTGNIGTKGVLNAVGAVIQGRVYNDGDDEGIIIKPSSNGYAGLILGAHNSERSIFYLTKGNPFWRYNNGSTNLDIQHPKKPGVIALTSDIPSSLKNPYSLTTFGVVYDGSAAKVVSPSNFISQVNEAASTVTDGTMFITSYTSNSGFADTNAVNVPYKRKAIHLWEYIKAKTNSLYATKSHNHDDRYVRAFGTSNDNIDSDWGQSFKTFDPIPSGTPPEQTPNMSILNIGNNFNRRKQLAFIYSNDNIYYRRHVDNSFTNWRRIAFANEIPTSLKNPYALTISLNGTSQGPYDGSAAKNINITPSSIGAATSGHNHDSSYVKYTKVTKSTADNTNATPYLYNVENEEVISGYYKYWYIFNMGQYSGGNFGTQIAMPYQDSLADSELFIRSAKSGSWRTWRRILHSNNYTAYTVTKNGTGANGTWDISITGNADTVDGYHISDESRQVYRNYYTVASPASAWILIKFPAWNANNEIVAIDGQGDNRHATCIVHCGSRNQGIWGYQSDYNGKVVDRIRWKEVDSGKFALVVLINEGITNLSIKSTSSLEISKTTEDNAAFAISSSFFSSSGVFHGNVDWDKIIGKPSSFIPSAHDHNYVLDIANNNHTTFAYSKPGISKDSITWLAVWNGYELRAMNKDQIALSGHTHDDRYYTKAESNAKYITDITTSVNKLTFTKNGSNIDKDIKVNVVYSQGNLTNISDKNATTKASSGLFIYNSYNQVIGTNSYSSVLSINTGGTIQIAGNWGDVQSRNLYWRSQSDRDVSSYPWKSWRTILDSENYSSTLDSRYYTKSEVNTKLGTYLPLSGGTMTGIIRATNRGGSWISGRDHCLIRSDDKTSYSYWSAILAIATVNGYWTLGHLGDGGERIGFNYDTDADYNAGRNNNHVIWLPTGGAEGTLALTSDNVASATRLQTARNLWGNSFNGTADISGTIRFNNVTSGLCEGIQWTCGDNDFARIKAGATGSNAGYLEIATADDGNEPIYVRQYTGVFSSVKRTLTLLDANGYTHFPSYINIGGNENNNSSPDRVWGSNSSDSYLRSYRTSALNVNYASGAGNADTVDYYHADSLFRDLGWWAESETHDANDITGNGAVFAYRNHSNVPTYGVLVTFKGGSDGYRWQMSKSYGNRTLYIRQRDGDNGTWSNWLRLLDESDLTWNNIAGKPSTFNPAAHTHTVFNNNLMIKGTNGISDSASIHLGIGDSDTGFKWISDGKCQVYANNVAVGEWTSGGMNWFKNPTVNGNKIWNAGNDGSGSELDADTVDGYHASKFPYINNNGIWRIYGNAAVAALADNTAGLSSWAFGESRDSRITYLGILKPSTATCGINAHGTIAVFGQGDTHLGIASDYVRANLQVFGGNADKIVWRKKVAFTDSNVASATKLATARTIWGQSFDGTRDIPINVAAKMPLVFFKRFDNNENAGYVGCGSTKNNNIYISSYINANIILDGNNIGIGTASPAYKLDVKGDIRATGNSYATHFYESSDKTLKKNIKSILSSANIPKIREFDWKDTEEHSYGFIAQELEEQGYGCLVNEANGKKTVNYTATLALTVAKLQNLINIQNKKISNLTKELKALKYGRKKNS